MFSTLLTMATAAIHAHDIGATACPSAASALLASKVRWDSTLWTVCQHSVPGGRLLFIEEGGGGRSIEIERSNEANYNSKPTWLNFTEDAIKNTTADLMGSRLLARGNP
eukprot:SAG31_NODE_20585_length_570_cov_0.853503_1_plen_108_part_10